MKEQKAMEKERKQLTIVYYSTHPSSPTCLTPSAHVYNNQFIIEMQRRMPLTVVLPYKAFLAPRPLALDQPL